MRRLAAAAAWLLVAVHSCAQADRRHADWYLRDGSAGDRLVVFVAGLAGEGTWTSITTLMDADEELRDVDYLVYHSPQSLDIEENARRVETILRDLDASYAETVYVGHSIGGIVIKRLLLREAGKPPGERRLPDLVITFGTPVDTDKFTVSLFKRLGARVFWAAVPELKREVFNIERLKEINRAWRTAVERSPLDEVRHVNVFGVQDDIAPVENETPSRTTVFVRGDHLGIVSPASADDCSWRILRKVLLDRDADPRVASCALR